MNRVAVGFDFDQTLGMDNHLERTAFGRLAEQFGVQIDINEPKTYAAIEALLVPFRAAEELMPEMLARFVEFLPPNPQLLDVDAHDLAGRYRQICYDLVDELVQPMSGAADCIKALVTNGIPVGILTNGWSELQERKIERALGDFPGPVLVSEEIGAYKPSAEAFRKLETALGVDPSNLWYVGDNPTNDIAGARAYGLRAVWINRDRQEYPAGLEPATAVIEHLAELWAIVRGT
jgi:HAD superfamily hydrolase (TIGR01549 family)